MSFLNQFLSNTFPHRAAASQQIVLLLGVFFFSLSLSAQVVNEEFIQPVSARQSSLGFSNGQADNAIDGDTNGNWRFGSQANSVSHTRSENNPWLEIDLGAVHQISKIELWNRTDCCRDRLTNMNILVKSCLEEPGTPVLEENYIANPEDGNMLTFTTAQTGRYVRIQLFVNNTYLHLAEVKVYGTPNLAEGRLASQSTNFGSVMGDRAVDGNTNGRFTAGSVASTLEQGNPWWEVDLGDSYNINRVEIWNRTDCCRERLDDISILVKET
ncbi:MAG: discoidin domain-containing protein, partial [Bacteroidota bacterium]